ncbi:MAG TPA: single-stranded-DNA-specific exonuclease RecJ [Bryobacteraceae bacterium]|nr:single-stranded-DNA-specific exonuclease RecJ [Bryobacteraceae bacterium]
MIESRWRLPAGSGEEAARLAASLGIGLPVAKVLCARDLRDPETARRFLNPSLDHLHPPELLAGLPKAVERLKRAIANGERILIYGDYDVDGTTAVVILKTAIRLAGGNADFKVPHRIRDGYGMREDAIREAAEAGVRLIVSVDTGIRAGEVVRCAAGLGVDVIVTDHHLPEADLPPAVAVLNPNRPDCPYPDKNLCGAGVAFKLAQALMATLGWDAGKIRRITESLLKLVAIGTVADVVPLTGENRIMVKHGLAGLGDVRSPGLRALLDVSGCPAGTVPTSTQVAFRIAPRINAAGRMDTAEAVIELFLTGDEARAREIAAQLQQLNEERQQTEEAITRQILDECLREPVDGRFALVFCGENWHRGVLGIVASRITERFHRPVFVLGLDSAEGLAQGSGRSIPAFHLLEALEAMPELFERFGGHKHAAGLTLRGERVPEFRERFNSWAAARLTPADLAPEVEIEALLELREINERSAAEVFALAPFGHGNPAPLFGALDVEVAGTPVVMKEKHLRVTVRQNGQTLVLKAWNFAGRVGELAPGTRLDVAFRLEEDPYSAARGYASWCAVLREFRQTGGHATAISAS